MRKTEVRRGGTGRPRPRGVSVAQRRSPQPPALPMPHLSFRWSWYCFTSPLRGWPLSTRLLAARFTPSICVIKVFISWSRMSNLICTEKVTGAKAPALYLPPSLWNVELLLSPSIS